MNKSAYPVYIVGAGPGDPDLITVKGRDLLAQADVVVYTNSLIPETMLQYCRADAEIIPTACLALEQILEILIERSLQQKLVVRLHDGDPSLYGAIHEQIDGLNAANIPVEIIPGVSAFQLAAARLQVELTVPELVQTIILTRMSGRTQVPEREDLASLAAHQASLCLYLSTRHVVEAQAKLMAHYPEDTPVAICYRLGWQDEKIVTVPLKEMAAATKSENLVRSTIYIISPALDPNIKGKIKFKVGEQGKRSQLYNSNHNRLFRSN